PSARAAKVRRHAPPSEPLAPLDRDKLESVVMAAHPGFSACFRGPSAVLPAATGRIIVEVAVASSGKVSSARANLPGPRPNAPATCLETEAYRLRFPRHPDKELRFAFPLVYRRG